MIETLEQSMPAASKYATRDRRIRLCERNMVDYFKQNKNEELSMEDAMGKFGLSERTARNSLGALVGDGVLERVSIYRWRDKP
jgi:Fic family protein